MTLSWDIVGYDKTNFSHKLLLINRQVENLREPFPNKSSTDINLSKSQLSKMIQSGRLVVNFFDSLLKIGLPLIKKLTKPLAKSVLITLILTAAASAADAKIHKKILGSVNKTLIISNDAIKYIIEIVKYLKIMGYY